MTQPVNLGDLLDRSRPAGATALIDCLDWERPREVLTTLTVSGYVLPGAPASKPEDKPQGPRKD